MKKESLSIMTVKTFLAVVIFMGIGTIIIGGGYIIGEYCKNGEDNKISNKTIQREISAIEISADKKSIVNTETKEVIFTIDDANKYLKDSNYAYNPDAFQDDKDTNADYAGDCFVDMALSNNKNKIVFSIGCLPLAVPPWPWVGVYQIQNPYKCPVDRFCEIIPASFNFLRNSSGRSFVWSVDDKTITYDKDSILTSERGREVIGTGTLTINSSTGKVTNSITRDVCYNNEKTELEMNRINQLNTYRDFIGGFEITFPSSWQNHCGSLREGGVNNKVNIHYYSAKDSLKWENMEMNNLDDIKKDIEKMDKFIIGGELVDEFYINNQLFLKYYFEHMGNEEEGFITIRDGIIYDISYPIETQTSGSDDPSIYEAISTFKFIEKDETADWKTYRNEEFGLEVKYPLDFKEQKIESDGILLEAMKTDRGSSYHLSMYVMPNYKIDQIVSKVSEAEEIIIGDYSGYKYFYIEGAGMSEVALIQLGEDALSISFDCIGANSNFATANDRKIFVQYFFNQILSTFKFIEKGEIADWKTYRNEEYGFEVKYSEDWEEINKTPAIMSFVNKDNENNIIQIRNEDRENDISLMEQIKGKGDIEPELIKINNRDLYFLKMSTAGLIFYEYYVENKNKIFTISMMNMPAGLSENAQDESDITYPTDKELYGELNILRTMVSTFKFIEN